MTSNDSRYRPSLGRFFAKRAIESILAIALLFGIASLGGEAVTEWILSTGLMGLCLTSMVFIFIRNVFLSKRDLALRKNSAYNALRVQAALLPFVHLVAIIIFLRDLGMYHGDKSKACEALVEQQAFFSLAIVTYLALAAILLHWRLGRLPKYNWLGVGFWLPALLQPFVNTFLLSMFLWEA